MAGKRMTQAAAPKTVKAAEMKAEKPVEPKAVTEKKPKKFQPDDMIQCRSNTVGLLLYNGHKSKLPYQFSNIGDVSYIAYEDILAAFMVNSQYIFKPLFIIEDEDVLADPRFAQVKRLYESLYDAGDIEQILNMSPTQFRNVLMNAPVGLKNVVRDKVGGMITSGEFDSIKKIEIIDSLCGTDFKSLV